MKKYINTSNYYLSTTTSKIENSGTSGTFDVSDVTVDWVTLPLTGYYWVDVDFGDASKREIFRIVSRTGYTLTYDARISPYGMKTHQSWASVGLRDFSQLLNSLSTNTDNFWEVEQTWDFDIKVRWWKVLTTWDNDARNVRSVEDTTYSISPNTTSYIVLDLDNTVPGVYTFSHIVSTALLNSTTQYPIAKIIAWVNSISEIIDLRSTLASNWDMYSSIYDPEKKALELYKMDNMEQSEDWQHMFVSASDILKWNEYEANKQDLLIPWVNIVTVDWNPIVWNNLSTYWWWTDIPITYSLSANYFYEYTEDWASTYTLTYNPIDEYSFIIFTSSWTMLMRDTDYSYNSETKLITFTPQLNEWENACIWILSRDWAPLNIWNWQITVKQWWTVVSTFNVNQQTNTEFDLQKWFVKTQAEYNALPDSKNSDNNFYFIQKL